MTEAVIYLPNPDGRATPEWRGKTLDSAIPDRVRLRVAKRDDWTCRCGCNRRIRQGFDKWQTDHIVAIKNGGANAERNLQTLLDACHKLKTGGDVAEKSKIYQKTKKNAGLSARKGPPMPGSRASKFKKTFRYGTVRRDA